MAQVKKAFKGLFKKKAKKEEAKPTTTAEASKPADAKPTETTPAAPAPATAPAPAKAEAAPAADGSKPAAPAPAEGETKKEEAALTEVKKATASRSTSNSSIIPDNKRDTNCWDGSRWRQKAVTDDDWTDRA